MTQRKSKRIRDADLTPQRQSTAVSNALLSVSTPTRRRKSFTDGLDEDDELRGLTCLEDLDRLRKRKTDPPVIVTRPAKWKNPSVLLNEVNTIDIDEMLQSMEPKSYRNRSAGGGTIPFKWDEARERLLNCHERGRYVFVQRRTTEVILEGSTIDMERIPFLLILEAPESDEKKVLDACPTHYYAKNQPANFDPEDYIPTSIESLYDLGAQWVRMTYEGKPLKAFVLASAPSDKNTTSTGFSTSSFGAAPTGEAKASSSAGFGGFSTSSFGAAPTGEAKASSSAGFGGFSTSSFGAAPTGEAKASSSAGFGGFSTSSFGAAPTGEANASSSAGFGGFSTSSFGAAPTGEANASSSAGFGGFSTSSFGAAPTGGANASSSAGFGGFGVPTKVSAAVLAELSLVIWDRNDLQEKIATWSAGMRLVYTFPVAHAATGLKKVVLDNDRGSVDESITQALERIWRGQNNTIQKVLAWKEECPLHSDSVHESLNKEIKKLMRQEQKECPHWSKLSGHIAELREKINIAVQDRTALKDSQLEVMRYALQLLKNGELPTRNQWFIVKHYPSKNETLPFRADLKVPGLGDPDLCIPEAYVFCNPLLSLRPT